MTSDSVFAFTYSAYAAAIKNGSFSGTFDEFCNPPIHEDMQFPELLNELINYIPPPKPRKDPEPE